MDQVCQEHITLQDLGSVVVDQRSVWKQGVVVEDGAGREGPSELVVGGGLSVAAVGRTGASRSVTAKKAPDRQANDWPS